MSFKDENDGTKDKKFSLSCIRFGIDAEIDKALSLYCRDELRLSKVYWPKAFRSLISSILQSLFNKPTKWRELSTANFEVDVKQLTELISELKLPTSHYIKVKQKRWLAHLLLEVSVFRKKIGISACLPKLCVEQNGWPTDLEDKDDLFSSLTDMSLRDDVRKFYWAILDEAIPSEKYCNMHFYGALHLLSNEYPIVIEVTEDLITKVTDRILTVSEQLRYSNYENLLPIDFVKVMAVADRKFDVPLEEGFHTSCSPWQEGTVGGIMKYGPRFIGITSGHVHRKPMIANDGICVEPDLTLSSIVDESVDVAFFTLNESEVNNGSVFNLMPMQHIGAKSEVHLRIGEPVYKIGKSTGLTIGTLGSIDSSPRFPGGFRYVGHIQVNWNDDNCRFAFSMDCGSIYCVKRGPIYIPIGIHRISGNNVSYGCSIWKAMEYFPELPDIQEPLNFVNPQFLTI